MQTTIDRFEVLELIRRQWLSTLLHDLSNPLFAARGYLRMVLEEAGGALSEPQHRYVTAILGNISKLVTMVQELQNFPGNDAFEFEVVRLKDLLKEAVAALHTSALEGKIRLAERLSDDPLSTIGDRQKLSQAMYEFLGATIKFASPGGAVEVSAREENEKIVLEFRAASASNRREG